MEQNSGEFSFASNISRSDLIGSAYRVTDEVQSPLRSPEPGNASEADRPRPAERLDVVERLVRQNAMLMEMLQRQGNEDAHRSYHVIPDFSKNIEDFDGEGGALAAEKWLRQVESAMQLHRWPPAFALETAKSHLKGAAKFWIDGHIRFIRSWESFCQAFSGTFLTRVSTTERWKRMQDKVQGRNETVTSYFHEKIYLCQELGLSFSETKEQVAIGLFSKELSNFVMSRSHLTENELYRDILEYERVDKARKSRVETKVPTMRAQNFQSATTSADNRKMPQAKRYLPAKDREGKPLCFRCKNYGHVSKNCSTPASNHTMTKVPATPVPSETNLMQSDPGSANEKYFKDATINGKPVKAYVDFGSQVCAILDSHLGVGPGTWKH